MPAIATHCFDDYNDLLLEPKLRNMSPRPAQNRVFPGKFDFSLGPVLFSLQMV